MAAAGSTGKVKIAFTRNIYCRKKAGRDLPICHTAPDYWQRIPRYYRTKRLKSELRATLDSCAST